VHPTPATNKQPPTAAASHDGADFVFGAATDGTPIFVRRWSPRCNPAKKGAVLIIHGLGEQSGKYDALGHHLAATGYDAYALDLRGHGRTPAMTRTDGSAWDSMTADVRQLAAIIAREGIPAPLVAFGHGMGSLITQSLMQTDGGVLAGAILCETAGSIPSLEDDRYQTLVDALRSACSGLDVDATTAFFAPLLNTFAGPIAAEPHSTTTVHTSDDMPGAPTFSINITYSVVEGTEELWSAESEARIPPELPVFIVAGGARATDEDKNTSIRRLINRYVDHGLLALQYRFYPECRSELIHDDRTKQRVQDDIGHWLSQIVDR
jgi:alpha-beta hydrolase superfamily lysophospholipase